MGLGTLLVGAAMAGFSVHPDHLGSIAPAEELTLPTSSARARLVVSERGPTIPLHPAAGELREALQVSRQARTIPGDFHAYAVRSLDVPALDGVALGSAWSVAGPSGAMTCSVTGFEHISAPDNGVTDVGAPCGAPLVQATLDCSGDFSHYGPSVALPAGARPALGVPVGEPEYVEHIDDHHLAPLVADPVFQARAASLLVDDEDGEVEVYFSRQVIDFGGQAMALLSGSVMSERDLFPFAAVVGPDGALVMRHEGGGSALVDADGDGAPELLGWSPVPGAISYAVSFVLVDDDAVREMATLNWCETGC